MKKFTVLMTLFALMASNAAFAQNSGNANKTMGKGANNGYSSANNGFAWGPALTGLAVLGVVVGVTAAAAAHTPSSFSH